MRCLNNYLAGIATSHYRTARWRGCDEKTPLAPHRRAADKALRALDFAAAYIRPSGTHLQRLREYACAAIHLKEEFLQRNKGNDDRPLLVFASRALRGDREVVLAAVSRAGENLAFASKALRDDREVVLTAIREDEEAFKFASETLRGDREIVLAVVSKSGWQLEFASKALRDDREVVLTAIREDPFALRYASKALRRDLEVVMTAIRIDPSALRHAPLDLQTSRDILTAYDPHLLELDIEFLARFSRHEDIKEIIRNRQNIGRKDSRKLAVLFYPKTDHSGSFNKTLIINTLIRTGFRVLYFEVASAQQLVALLKAATAAQKADVLAIAGHGTRRSIQLGRNSHITSGDRTLFQQEQIKRCLTNNSSVLLQACSTANVNGKGQNLANFFGEIFPHSIIIAAKVDSGEILLSPYFDSTGRVIGMGLSNLPEMSEVIVLPPLKST